MDKDDLRKLKKVEEAGEGYVKGLEGWMNAGGRNYKVTFPETTTTAVNVMDKTSRATQIANAQAKVSKLVAQSQGANVARAQKASAQIPKAMQAMEHAKTGPPRGSSVFRLDNPHAGHMYEHININPEISGIPDPHYKISPGTLQTGTGAAKVAKALNTANKVLVPVAIAIDTVKVGLSVKDDIDNGTTRKTVETAAQIGGGWGGGFGGASAGAAIGTAIFPGVGTLVGGIVGGLSGGIGGSMLAETVVSEISDAAGYNIEERRCKKCERRFTARLYLGENNKYYCDSCA